MNSVGHEKVLSQVLPIVGQAAQLIQYRLFKHVRHANETNNTQLIQSDLIPRDRTTETHLEKTVGINHYEQS